MAPKKQTVKEVTGSSTDPVFTPVIEALTAEQLEYLSQAFGGLSLSDQRTVAEKYETAINVLQSQKKALGFSVKQIDVKIKNVQKKENNQTEDKPPSLRKSKEDMDLNIVIDGARFNVSIKPSDRFGTLRQYIVRQWGMKKDQKVSFDKLNGQPFPLHPKHKSPPNGSSFIYTFNVQNGDVVEASWIDDTEAEADVDAEPLAMPIGESIVNHDSDDTAFVEQTIAEMGLVDGDESCDEEEEEA